MLFWFLTLFGHILLSAQEQVESQEKHRHYRLLVPCFDTFGSARQFEALSLSVYALLPTTFVHR